MSKPFSQACVNNQQAIAAALQQLLVTSKNVLEIGSGTGQHAVYFGAQLPQLQWHTSDRSENHQGIQQWLDEADLNNVHQPLPLDVSQPQWPEVNVDAIFSANSVHIMGWSEVEQLFAGVGQLLPVGGLLLLYGPFNYNNQYTSDSNARFDLWLKQQNPVSAIRHFEAVNKLATDVDLELQHDIEMPANNRILCWCKR
ncbi:MAG: DUF938 domain-containing protein [Motiliproteus sp.]